MNPPSQCYAVAGTNRRTFRSRCRRPTLSEQPFVRIRVDLWLDAAKKSGDFLLTNLAKPLSCESRESGPPPA